MSLERWTAASLVALGLGLALNSLLGPFLLDVIDYPLSETAINQTVGLDAFSLVVAAPLCAFAAVLTLRRAPAAPLLALGLATYAGYMLIQYLVGPAYLEVPGVLILQLALLAICGWLAVASWAAIDPLALPWRSDAVARRVAFAMFAIAAFLLLRYIPTLIDSITGEPLSEAAAEDPTLFWLIVVLDLAAVLPAALAAGVAVLRGVTWGRTAAYAVAAWFGLAGPSIAAMAVAMQLRDDPYATTIDTAFLIVVGAIFAAFALWLFAPFFDRARPDQPMP